MKKGFFLTVEGVDGSGKSTQLALLLDYLHANYPGEVLSTREPGGCDISERIRSLILDPALGEMTPRTEALLYAAARAQHVQQVILPALARGALVVCDRFLDSSLAYQAWGRELGEEGIRSINTFAMGDLQSDLTLFYNLSREEALRRRGVRATQDRLESAGEAFELRVDAGYRALSAREGHRICEIDASGSIEETFEKTKAVLREKLHLTDGPV